MRRHLVISISEMTEMTMILIEGLPAKLSLGSRGLDCPVAARAQSCVKREKKMQSLPLKKMVPPKHPKACAECVVSRIEWH
jgi:hypothetical protein